MKSSISAHLLRAGLIALVTVTPAAAQLDVYTHEPKVDIMPFGGFQWGGAYRTDALAAIPAGELRLGEDFAWGMVVSFHPQRYSALELWYLRQDTEISFDRVTGLNTPLGGFANNYIQIGGRQEFPTGTGLRPFIGGTLGTNILDPKALGAGTTARFAFSFGGGLQYMMGAAQRFGIRSDLRWWVTTVPAGTYGTWCDFYGCYVAQGVAWVSQGQVSGGVVFAF